VNDRDQPRQTSDSSVATDASGATLAQRIAQRISAQSGWMSFEAFMGHALYEPGLGYYSRGDRQFGLLARDGSDFVTAPEISPLFGRALARQVAQIFDATGLADVVEFGAGTGALAAQLLDALGDRVASYRIVDLSGSLRTRQQQTLRERVPQHVHRVQWLDGLPLALEAVVVGNEVLDAMPVVLLHRAGGRWLERGVMVADASAAQPQFAWVDRETDLKPPVDGFWPEGSTLELPRQATAFMTTLATVLRRGAALFIDYGFPEAEFYHPQRHMGTLVCHRGHQMDVDPLQDPGDKDITAHVDFTAVALAAQDAGLDVLGYTSQANFLINLGLVDDLAEADVRQRAMAQKLLNEHEMGELFKVLAVGRGVDGPLRGFERGDRIHRL
jgi:SAM-dependent MidA family methyltransferase